MNERFFSLWLVTQDSERAQLQNIVNQLAEKCESPGFIPHLTLIGDLEIDLDKFKDITDEVLRDETAFQIRASGVSYSEKFAKSVFIEFEVSDILKKLFLSISEKTDGRPLSTFKPHISLMYKNMPIERKREIAEAIEVNPVYHIDKACITNPAKIREDYYDVEEWRIFYQKDLPTQQPG